MTARHVTLIPGDGIGPEVVDAARRAMEATGVALAWDEQVVGVEAYERGGDALPAPVLASIQACGVALKGPVAAPRDAPFRSVNVSLRRALDLFAGIRPCRAYRGAPVVQPGTDLVVIRMNHEDLYAGLEYASDDPTAREIRRLVRAAGGPLLAEDTAISLKPLSSREARRIGRAAVRWARAHGRRRLTCVHKANVMRHTDGVFLRGVREEAAAAGMEADDLLVDAACARLVTRPQDLDVLVMPMLYGDIVSDLGAGLVGGLGLAPGANIGPGCAVFEAVHGTAARHAGRDRANPMALMLSGAMLLDHVGEHGAARRLEAAVAEVIGEGETVSYDLRPDRDPAAGASTSRVADAVVARLRDDCSAGRVSSR